MTLKELREKLDTMGLPLAYQEFPKQQAPDYIAYFEDDSESITADGVVVILVQNVEIHMITKQRDLAKEAILETILTVAGLTWERSHDYDSKQKVFDTAYSLQLIN